MATTDPTVSEDAPLNLPDVARLSNRFTEQLPADPQSENYGRHVHGAAYSRVRPASVVDPKTVAHSPEVAQLLGLPSSFCESDSFAQVFAGNRLLEGMDPYAMCYGGHQFGNWAGQLGDGRAINLGELETGQNGSWVLQLKGAGPTPYSRTADGLAVLRSSVREFLCSEAMHHLGVPTTRALSLVTTGEPVMRDMLYDGHARYEPGAVVCRVAPSFLRFGSFEIQASRGDDALLKQLADFTLRNHFPHLGEPGKATYVAWFEEVCQRTAEMVRHWMRVGFVHGVMNTDNMSVLGLTIDYGPYGWLENFDPDWTPNTTDAEERIYRFGRQPHVALWNLLQFAKAISPLIGEAEPLQAPLRAYSEQIEPGQRSLMLEKLGLGGSEFEEDEQLALDLVDLLRVVETDMTIFFRKLADVRLDSGTVRERMTLLESAYYTPSEVSPEHSQKQVAWLQRYAKRVERGGLADSERKVRMNRVNPKYVLRNYLAQLAIDEAEKEDPSKVLELLEVLRRPYDEQPEMEAYAAKRPDWARSRVGCSMLSCSS